MASDVYAGWLTKIQAADQIGISERTLERMIARKKIQIAHRRIPGEKPKIVCNPKDVERMAAATAQPVWIDNTPMRQTASVSDLSVQTPQARPDLAGVLTGLLDRVQPRHQPRFVNIEAAARYSGLPEAHIRRLVSSGKLRSIRAGAYYVRTTDLDRL